MNFSTLWARARAAAAPFARSLTIWVAAVITALPEIAQQLQAHWPEVAAYLPAAYHSRAISLLGLIVLVARMRTLVKLPPGAAPVLLALILGAAALVPREAAAQVPTSHTASATWTHPTSRTDGVALPLAEVRETRIEWARCPDSTFPATPEGLLIVAAPAAAAVLTGLPFDTRLCFRALTVTTANEISDPSATVTLVTPRRPPARPRAPTGLTVTIVIAQAPTVQPAPAQ